MTNLAPFPTPLLREFCEAFGAAAQRVRLPAVMAAWGLALALVGCNENERPPVNLDGLGSSDLGVEEGPCDAKEPRQCSIKHEQANGVISCFTGVQHCEEGRWGVCSPAPREERSPMSLKLPSLETMAVSASACSFNACDPGCMVFDDPSTELVPVLVDGSTDLEFPDFPPWKNEPCASGLDCQINHRCEDVATASACTHSKCIQGTGLLGSCDPCVQRICEEMPSCCSDDGLPSSLEWNDECVALVATECDASCGDPAGPSCDHQLCDEGAALASSCDPCVAEICDQPGFEYCCDAAGSWDSACVRAVARSCNPLKPVATGDGNHRCDYALMGRGALAIYGAAIKGGDVGGGTGANALVEIYGIRPQITHSIYSQGSLDLYHADVGGDVKAGGSLDPSRCLDLVAGVCQAPVAVPSPSVPARPLLCASGATHFAASGSFAPGSYGHVSVAVGATLRLQAGVYRMASLTVADGARLELPATGSVHLDSCGDISFGVDVRVIGASAATDALRFLVYTNGSVTIGSRSFIYGMFSAPSGNGYMGQGTSASKTTLIGLLHTVTATLMPRSEINATGIAGAACSEILVDPPAQCPITVGTMAPPSGVGSCIPQEEGDVDPTCSGSDLALGEVCGDVFRVCNHGQADAPAGAELSFYSLAGSQFATTEPDDTTLLGTCPVTEAIPSGECVEQTCSAALLSDDALVMVNRAEDAALNECSLLDNWTLFEAGRSCGGVPSVMTETRLYEATCPGDRLALWGLLTWDTETPGASEVVWRAKTGFSEGELVSVPWTELGVAARAGSDTQVCTALSGQAVCPIDLSAKLALQDSAPSFLELQIQLNPDGLNAPKVSDFRVTYSCVDDQ